MEDSKKTTIAVAPAAAAGQAAGQAGYVAAALAGGGGVVTTVVKPGWRTSEMWITVALPAALQALTWVSHVPGPWGIVAGAVGAGLYSLSRGIAKRGPS